MNREIKFRAWDIKGKRMLTPILINIKNKTFSGIVEQNNIGNWDSVYRFDQVRFMQFTGLHDKNGVPIYEGDVVKVRNYNGYENKVVEFDGGCFYAGFHSGSSTKKTFKLLNNKTIVLGNEYQNPELLKKDGN